MTKQAFIFSGQGAQIPGMMKELSASYSTAKEVFNTAERILGRDISRLCFYGAQEELELTRNTQPCVLAADLAAFAAITECGVKPDAVAGFSLGEYAALVAASVISIEDAFEIIQIRADAMQEAVPVGKGAMAAIMKLDMDEVKLMCEKVDGYVIPANFNTPTQLVVSGTTEAVDRVIAIAKAQNARAVKLQVSAPFHCELMEPARKKLERTFARIQFCDASIPVYMNVDGKAHTKATDIKQCLLRQTVSAVQWVETMNSLYAAGIREFIELGPGSTLTGFAKKITPESHAISVNNPESLLEALDIVRKRQLFEE